MKNEMGDNKKEEQPEEWEFEIENVEPETLLSNDKTLRTNHTTDQNVESSSDEEVETLADGDSEEEDIISDDDGLQEVDSSSDVDGTEESVVDDSSQGDDSNTSSDSESDAAPSNSSHQEKKDEKKDDEEFDNNDDKNEDGKEEKMPDHSKEDEEADKLNNRNNNNVNNNNNHNNINNNTGQNNNASNNNELRQPHANNPLNQNRNGNQNNNQNKSEQNNTQENKFNEDNRGNKQNKTNDNDVGARNIRKALANKLRSPFGKNKKKNDNSQESKDDSKNDDESKESNDESKEEDKAIKRKLKRFIRKLIIFGLIGFLVGLFVFVFAVSVLEYFGFDVSISGLIGIKTYDTDYYQPTYEPGTKENKDEIKYYKKLDEIAKNYGSEHGVELKNGYIHMALMYYYYQIDVMWEMEENNTSVDYNKMIDMADKLSKAIAEEFGDEEIDYAIDGRLYNLFKNNEDLKKYHEKTLKNMDMDNLLNDVFKQAEGLENIEFTDEEVLTSETKVTVVETKKETSTKTETKKTTTLTVNQYIADSIYANSTTLNSESVKAYTIAYSTKLASQNNKLSIDSSNVSASNSLCSVSLGCSYDVDGNLVSGGNDQSTKNTYFYKGQYYYKKPLNSEEITTLNKDINSVFGNVLVNSDGTYPDLDVEKINGLGDSYKTILTNSYGNLSYKNIGEDSYILDGSYGTKQVKSSVIFYDQNDFASYNFCGKKNETIKSSGCGTTSMAIIVSTYEKNSKYDPVFMTGEARKTGYCGGGITGTSPGFFKKEANTMKYKYYKASKYSKKDLNLVLQHLSQGHLVIAHMSAGHFTSGGHYMVLGGVDPDTKKVYVYDPYSKVNKSYRGTGTGWYSFNDIIVKEAWNFYIIWKG